MTAVPDANRLLPLLITAACASLLTLLASGFLRSSPETQLSSIDSDGLAPLIAELRDLTTELRLATRDGRLSPSGDAGRQPPSSTTERRAVLPTSTGSADPGTSSIDRLTRSIETLVASVHTGGGSAGGIGPISLEDRQAPVRWDRLGEFVNLHRTDPKAARRSVVFSSIREIVRRFGFPTESSGGSGKLWMTYENKIAPDGPVRVYLQFVDGILMYYEVP